MPRPKRDLDNDDASPSRKDWMREVQRAGRASGVLATPACAEGAATSVAASAPIAASAAAAPANSLTGLFALASAVGVSGAAEAGLIAEYSAALRSDGVSGVIVGGKFSEGPLLSVEKRKAQVRGWLSTGMPVVMDVSAAAPTDVAELVAFANTNGVVGIVVEAPTATPEVAAGYLSEVAAISSKPILVGLHDQVREPFDTLRACGARVAAVRGCVFYTANLNALARIRNAKQPWSTTVVHADDSTLVGAALLGVDSFASAQFSIVAPLLAKVVAAAKKGDTAAVQKLVLFTSRFAAVVEEACAGDALRSVAVMKALASLRLEREIAHPALPWPRLNVRDAQQLRDNMTAFIADYAASIKPAAPAAAPAATTINVHAMPGFKGDLDAEILERARRCGREARIRNIESCLPHLGRNWRGRLPGRDCDVARFIDHTVLKPEVTAAEITKLTGEARKHNFYAVCVNGCRVQQCMDELDGTNVKVAAVIGFPLGAMTSKAKAREAREIVNMGAQEIDMVMNVGAMKDGDLQTVYEDIHAVVEASKPAIVKVIFETCLLTREEIIDASILSVAAGAGFIKTSTGFNKGGATPEAIDIMLAVAGNECQVKASGGVRTAADALAYITAGVRRIGTSSGVAIISGAASAGGY